MFTGVAVDLISKRPDSEELPLWWNDAAASAAMVVQRTWTGRVLQVSAPMVDWHLIAVISKLMTYAVRHNVSQCGHSVFLILRYSDRIAGLIGKNGILAESRLIAITLAAIAANMIDGLIAWGIAKT